MHSFKGDDVLNVLVHLLILLMLMLSLSRGYADDKFACKISSNLLECLISEIAHHDDVARDLLDRLRFHLQGSAAAVHS